MAIEITWQRDHNESPDLADLVLLARSCLPVADDEPVDFAACEQLPCFRRMQTFLQLTRSLEQVVADAEESIEQTLEMFAN